MKTDDLLKRVHRIEIKTRAITQNMFAGEYHSAFKGRGMSFSEVREYQIGDDVRDIDWNVTARTNRTHIKVYEEERELTVILLIDVSNSLMFGTKGSSERDLVTEIAATLSFSADLNKDKIGVIFFSDRIEKFIPPQKGRKHILYIIRELLNLEPQSKQTNLSLGLEYMLKVIPRRCIAFMLSDFIGSKDFETNLRIAARRHDVVALKVYDAFQQELPDVGLLEIVDAETRQKRIVDTSSEQVRRAYRLKKEQENQQLHNLFRKSKVDYIDIPTGVDYTQSLLQLFRQR